MKELKIEIPEGHEIDQEKSTFEKIIFKKVGKPMQWEDLEKIDGYYVDTGSDLISVQSVATILGNNKNVFPTKKDAESSLALAQLLQLRKAWIGEWEVDWGSNCLKYNIDRCGNNLITESFHLSYSELSFPTEEMALHFSEAFKDLIKVYYKL